MPGTTVAAAPVTVAELRGRQEVVITGLIDRHSVPDLRLALHGVVDRGRGECHLRLAGAEIGDATGLGLIVELYVRGRRRGRRVAVLDMTERTHRLLRGARLERALVHRDPQAVVGEGGLTVAPLTA